MARGFLKPGQNDSRICSLRSENTIFANRVAPQSSKRSKVYNSIGATFALTASKWVAYSPDGVRTLLYRMAAYAFSEA